MHTGPAAHTCGTIRLAHDRLHAAGRRSHRCCRTWRISVTAALVCTEPATHTMCAGSLAAEECTLQSSACPLMVSGSAPDSPSAGSLVVFVVGPALVLHSAHLTVHAFWRRFATWKVLDTDGLRTLCLIAEEKKKEMVAWSRPSRMAKNGLFRPSGEQERPHGWPKGLGGVFLHDILRTPL